MKRMMSLVAVVAMMLMSLTAMAKETTPMVARPLVTPKGHGEIGFDLYIGLNKGAMAKNIGLRNASMWDRYQGLSFAYGLANNFELGLAVDAFEHNPGNNDFGQIYLWGKYAFLKQLGVELGVKIPSMLGFTAFSDKLVSVQLSVPFKMCLVKNFLALHSRMDFVFGFAKKSTLGGGKSVQISMLWDLGVLFNFTKALYLDLDFGIFKALSPSGSLGIPLAVTFGYTVIPDMDIFLAFQFNNLHPAAGGAIDSKGISLGLNYRF